jgi:hypothetical protein
MKTILKIFLAICFLFTGVLLLGFYEALGVLNLIFLFSILDDIHTKKGEWH